MRLRASIAIASWLALATPVAAQTDGGIGGRVRESSGPGAGIAGAKVIVVGTGLTALTDFKGRYRLGPLHSGWYVVRVEASGYGEVSRDSVPVHTGVETAQDFFLAAAESSDLSVALAPVVGLPASAAAQLLTAEDFPALPLTSPLEAESLWIGVEGTGYLAGRRGAQGFLIDGIPVRSPYDASTAPRALRLPLGLLHEMWFVPSQASLGSGAGLTGVQGMVTRNGGDHWGGHLEYRSDRPFTGAADLGFDRLAATLGGPLGKARVIGVVDVTGRLEADPHGAPVGNSRAALPWEVVHNSGEWEDAGVKLTLPLGERQAVRVLGAYSRQRLLLFDPVFKYDPESGSAQAVNAALIAAELARSTTPLATTVRVSYLTENSSLSELTEPVDYRFGAIGGTLHLRDIDVARRQDSDAATGPLPGFAVPEFSSVTPWGVPAFFLGGGSRGDLLWSQYREARLEVGVRSRPAGWRFESHAAVSAGQVRAFQRVLAYLPVADSVPPATTARFNPISFSSGLQIEGRLFGASLRGGVRADGVSPRGEGVSRMLLAASAEFEIATSLGPFQVSAYGALPRQFPDLQFLTDVAFDDSLAGGRFRSGNPELAVEKSALVSVMVATEPWQRGSIRVRVIRNLMTDLVESAPATPADSSRLDSRGRVTVHALEVLLEHRVGRRARIGAGYSYERAEYDAATGFRIPLAANGSITDRLHRLVVMAYGRLPVALEAGLIGRVNSGSPFNRVLARSRYAQFTLDAQLARETRIGRVLVRPFVEARNLFDHQTAIAWRRDTGNTGLTAGQVDSLAQAALAAGPVPIQSDSPRFRPYGDTDGNGTIEGSELQALYQLAAEDFGRSPAAFGAPRTVRLGVTVEF